MSGNLRKADLFRKMLLDICHDPIQQFRLLCGHFPCTTILYGSSEHNNQLHGICYNSSFPARTAGFGFQNTLTDFLAKEFPLCSCCSDQMGIIDLIEVIPRKIIL